jgi:hypothetical protein
MKFWRARNGGPVIREGWLRLKLGEHFNYLGSMLDEGRHCSKKIRKTMARAKEAFVNRRELMTGTLSENEEKRLVKILA